MTAAPDTTTDSDLFLSGNFAPVDGEVTLDALPVRGALPPELDGMLLRDGPNPIAPRAGYHWFTGDAMIHGIKLSDGRALGYRNRYVRTANVAEHLGLDAPAPSPHQPPIQGSGNVNVIHHAGRILALSEVGLPYALDADLGTLGQYDFAGRLRSHMTAHPKIDAATGELLFFGYDLGDVTLRYHVADASGALVHSVDIAKPTPSMSMMHDFAVTETRVVHMDLPITFDIEMVAAGKSLPFRWDDAAPSRLGVMPRRGGSDDVVWIDIDPCYVFHVLNAYDEGQRIVMDVVRYERIFVGGDIDLAGDAGKLVRWVVDPQARTVESRVLDTAPQEFPRVDPRVETRKHRYGYSVSVCAADPPRGFDGLIKHDLRAGTRTLHAMAGGRAPGEGVFVPVGAGEDEGYVLSVVYDPGRGASELIVLDATDFAAAPVATVELPVRVPFGFHGNWVPASAASEA